MKPWQKRAAFHILIWLLYFSMPYLLLPKGGPPQQGPPMHDGVHGFDGPFDGFLLFNLYLISFFYLNYLYLVPRFFLQKKYVVFALAVFASGALFIYIPVLIDNLYGIPEEMKFHFMRTHPMDSMFRFLTIFLASSALKLVFELGEAENLRKEIEQEKTNSELQALKSQINPHFLFNTLNTIYSLTLDKSDLAPEAVMKLSHIMRYVTNDAAEPLVLLSKEFEHLENYIALQKMRLNENMLVNFTVKGETGPLKIAPLILIPIVENAFKYGVSTSRNATINVAVAITAGKLNMRVSNTKFKNKTDENDATGIGLKNTRRRLDLSYPGQYTLDITENEKDYSINLSITLL